MLGPHDLVVVPAGLIWRIEAAARLRTHGELRQLLDELIALAADDDAGQTTGAWHGTLDPT